MTHPDSSAAPGTPVHADYRKFDGTPHWQADGLLLGVDEHGVWVGFPTGTHFERPGAAFDMECDSVSLFPDAGFTPAFNDVSDPERVQVYVDTTTPPSWSRTEHGWRVTMIDLDLDVVRRRNGFIYVDDEDEFLDHQKEFGYPPDLVEGAESTTRAVFTALRDARAPFDDSGWRWLAALRDLA
ncbi:DUF402 domain-containing protein [Flexivirga oryzae]|uniref:DUF402 domain-containing protein n=1 Tax=Flexivirga oryzae TaxID=1794944 RepID=A0A839MZM8_9MICO|nr:DUF402 domain-containing protein [Flexivirga oryzae]MBB2890878.1 hypothetical protein [Flexivirga oryzae]